MILECDMPGRVSSEFRPALEFATSYPRLPLVVAVATVGNLVAVYPVLQSALADLDSSRVELAVG